MIPNLLAVFASALLSFLPTRYRAKWVPHESGELVLGTILSGLAEAGISIALLLTRYMTMFAEISVTIGLPVLNNPSSTNKLSKVPMDVAAAGVGVLSALDFAVQLTNVLLVYFMIEGLVRSVTAVSTRETLPSLPVAGIGTIHSLIEAWNRKRKLGPRIEDEIIVGEAGCCEFRIRSCRPKPDWHRHVAIRYRDDFYHVFKEEIGPKPRPFVFHLRKSSMQDLIVTIRDYNPRDVLREI